MGKQTTPGPQAIAPGPPPLLFAGASFLFAPVLSVCRVNRLVRRSVPAATAKTSGLSPSPLQLHSSVLSSCSTSQYWIPKRGRGPTTSTVNAENMQATSSWQLYLRHWPLFPEPPSSRGGREAPGYQRERERRLPPQKASRCSQGLHLPPYPSQLPAFSSSATFSKSLPIPGPLSLQLQKKQVRIIWGLGGLVLIPNLANR